LKDDIPYTYLEFGSNPNVDQDNGNISLDQTNTKTFIAKGINPIPITNTNGKEVFVPNLFNSNDENLNRELGVKDRNNLLNPENFNLLVSEATAYKYNIGIGSKINIKAKNDIDRYYKKNEINYTFTIKGVYSSYYGDEFFINQEVANEILGYNETDFDTSSYYIDRE
jgi:ABC-type lipoprotein release transport system permease subunit